MFFPLGRIETAMKSWLREGILVGPASDLEPGSVVNGCYRIEQCIVQNKTCRLYTVTRVYAKDSDPFSSLKGGKPVLYREHSEMDLPPGLFQMEVREGWLDPVLVQRLLSLSDPRLAPIYDVFVLENQSYVVSAHIDGVRLDHLKVPLNGKQIRRAGICLCKTVESLHRHGIFGMDLGFSNLRIVDETPQLISLATSRADGALSEPDVVSSRQKDLLKLLETLEKLVAEYGVMRRNAGLVGLLLAIEDMVAQNRMSPREIQKSLNEGRG